MADSKINKKEVIELPVGDLQANPLQPRGVITPDSLMELVDSIKEHGVLEPLVVAHTPAGYQIIAGERRWRAAKIAGLEKVPVLVKETSPQGMLEMALVENVQRTDLNPLERAKAFERLREEFRLNTVEIAQRISKSSSYISNSLKLLQLPDALKDGLLSGLISEGHARALQAIVDKRLMIEAYKIILRESGSVRRAEDIARRMKVATGQQKAAGKKTQKKHIIIHEEIDKISDEINEVLGEKTKVKLIRTERQTRLYITLQGSPEATEENLQKIYKSIVGK